MLLKEKNIHPFWQFIYTAREKIIHSLQNNISSGRDELGIAEALLIGYTNDLDKDLVQAYSNTGVVHIIAISGMHLALIYVMLVWLFARIPGIKKSKWLQVLLILSSLWLFSLLTGGSASVLLLEKIFSNRLQSIIHWLPQHLFYCVTILIIYGMWVFSYLI